MLNFNKINYKRIDFDTTKEKLNLLISRLKKENDFFNYLEIVKEINNIQNHIEQMYDYADIKNMRYLEDEYYKEEINYWNNIKPDFDLLFLPFYNEINNSKFYIELTQVLPPNFLSIIKYQSKINSESILELQKLESELKLKYRNLNKNKILYDGEEKTIGSLATLFTSKDRDIRKKAHDALNDFYYQNANEYDEVIFELVKVRNEIAKRLGFENYVEYSIYKLKRLGYNYKDIGEFRKNIIKNIIPICKIISNWQKEELNLEELKYYDTIFFENMPELKYHNLELLEEFKKSFAEVDKDLSFLFNNMVDKNYLDLAKRDDKVNFAITNYLVESFIPTVTGNYKNSYLDVQTTSHEMGHAFQKYCSSFKDKEYIVSPLLKYPPMEIAEMFSYGMELIMMDHVTNLFNEEDYKKYCFMKINSLISMLPYICLVDEFQEKIYSNKNLKKEDIRKTWLDLVKIYHMEKSNQGHINLEQGGYFYRQSHIYLDPFYYIDYALSYFGAFAIWDSCHNNLDLFKEIGAIASYYSFNELINKYNMPNPFLEETVENISKKLETELKNKRIIKSR